MDSASLRRGWKIYDGRKEARLGTQGNPVVVSVKTKAKEKEVRSILSKNGWVGDVKVNPDAAEDLSALERLQNPPAPVKVEATPGRNDPCPCGSGKKYKKCHGA